MAIDEAIALTLHTTSPPSRAPARAAGDCPLTRRELEIAGLVAEGLSNRAIAEKLVLSSQTVDGHMERILTSWGSPHARRWLPGWRTGRPPVADDGPHRERPPEQM